jgi:hypothetical protein
VGEAPTAARVAYVEGRQVALWRAIGDSSACGGRGPVELGRLCVVRSEAGTVWMGVRLRSDGRTVVPATRLGLGLVGDLSNSE